MHRQWTEESFDFEGRHYRLEDSRALPKPVQSPHPPLIVGGAARRGTVEPAVRFADEYNTTFATPATLRERRQRLDEACGRAGRDPATLRFSLMTTCVVATRRGRAPGARAPGRRRHGRPPTERRILAATRETGVVGTVEQVREHLAELEAAGVERVFLQHLDHRDLEMVALVGRELV